MVSCSILRLIWCVTVVAFFKPTKVAAQCIRTEPSPLAVQYVCVEYCGPNTSFAFYFTSDINDALFGNPVCLVECADGRLITEECLTDNLACYDREGDNSGCFQEETCLLCRLPPIGSPASTPTTSPSPVPVPVSILKQPTRTSEPMMPSLISSPLVSPGSTPVPGFFVDPPDSTTGPLTPTPPNTTLANPGPVPIPTSFVKVSAPSASNKICNGKGRGAGYYDDNINTGKSGGKGMGMMMRKGTKCMNESKQSKKSNVRSKAKGKGKTNKTL